MGWLKPLLELFSALAGLFRDKQLMDAGKAEQRAADTAKNSEIKDDQIKAAMDKPVDRADLLKRLRDGGGL